MDLIASVRRRALDPTTRTDRPDLHLADMGKTLSEREISAIEQELELRFPETLRRLYMEVGDGGFGPGYGFLKMRASAIQHEETVVGLYRDFCVPDPSDPSWKWPEGLILISDWGCAIRTGVICATNKIVVFDPNLHDTDWAATFLDQGCTLDQWLEKWCDGVKLWKEIQGATA